MRKSAMRRTGFKTCWSQVQTAAEQAEQADDDEIDRDDVVEQTRLEQDEDSGEQGDNRSETDLRIHGDFLAKNRVCRRMRQIVTSRALEFGTLAHIRACPCRETAIRQDTKRSNCVTWRCAMSFWKP